MMPQNAIYYFTQASIKRAMPAEDLKNMAKQYGLTGNSYPTVTEALKSAKEESDNQDFIFVGGSCFIVADLLSALEKEPFPFEYKQLPKTIFPKRKPQSEILLIFYPNFL